MISSNEVVHHKRIKADRGGASKRFPGLSVAGLIFSGLRSRDAIVFGKRIVEGRRVMEEEERKLHRTQKHTREDNYKSKWRNACMRRGC
jgi:hypothetical protein